MGCTCCLSGVQNDSGPHYKLMCKSILHIDAQIYRKFILSAAAIFWTTTRMMLVGITLAGPHCRSDNGKNKLQCKSKDHGIDFYHYYHDYWNQYPKKQIHVINPHKFRVDLMFMLYR